MNYSKNILILLYFSVANLFESCYTETCIQESSCFCQITENTKIDLSNLLEKEKILEDDLYLKESNETIIYRFSGCKDETHNGCAGQTISASLIRINGIHCTDWGNASQIKFNWDSDNGYQIIYQNDSKPIFTVNLICANQFKQPYFKIIDDPNKVFLVSSPEVCVKTEHKGLSGGSVFLIILIVMAVVYFIGGGLVLYFIRGARGVEIVPNVDFWRNLPGLVKDGAIFLLSGCKPTFVTTAETYDRI